MPTPAPTFLDLYDLGKAEAVAIRPDLAVKEGDVSDMLISGAAAMADRVIGFTAERFAATFLDSSRGSDLSTLADDHWGIQRQAATKATGTVTITRSGATAATAEYPIGTVVATARDAQGNEIRYVTTAAATWAISTNGARTVATEAETAGSAANLVETSLVTRILSASPGGGTYAITASSAQAGGGEEETDDELRARVRAYPTTLRRGTISALEYAARSVPGVAKATAEEDTTGGVTIYVSDSDGASTGDTVNVSPDVVDDGSMTKKVAVEVEEWRAAGSLVTIVGGAVQTVDISVTLTVRLGVDVAALVAQVQASIEAAVNRLQISETLYKSLISAAARIVDPDNIVECEITAPLTNTAPTAGYLIRAGTITVT